MTHGVRLLVSGERACFTRPEMKVERVSYDMLTPSAARGILEAIHWKPAIRWVIERIHVLRPIRFESIRRNEVADKVPPAVIRSAMRSGDLSGLRLDVTEARQQRAATILVDVAYLIDARFVMTPRAGAEDNPGKHAEMFMRRARKGQCFHQPCLGTREFPARFALIEPGAPPPRPEAPLTRDLGFMLWDIDHARGTPMFFDAKLRNGVVEVPPPGSPEIRA